MEILRRCEDRFRIRIVFCRWRDPYDIVLLAPVGEKVLDCMVG